MHRQDIPEGNYGHRQDIDGMIEKSDCEYWRKRIKELADDMWTVYRATIDNRAEVCANFMLSFRHLEDASMRLGKAIQAIDGGVSVYDKTQVPINSQSLGSDINSQSFSNDESAQALDELAAQAQELKMGY